EPIAPEVGGDAEQPGAGGPRVAQPPALPPRPQEGLLREFVGGVRVVAQVECEAVDARHPLFEEVAHRTALPSTPPRRGPDPVDRRTGGAKVKRGGEKFQRFGREPGPWVVSSPGCSATPRPARSAPGGRRSWWRRRPASRRASGPGRRGSCRRQWFGRRRSAARLDGPRPTARRPG